MDGWMDGWRGVLDNRLVAWLGWVRIISWLVISLIPFPCYFPRVF